jgi:hypothetical protein
MKLPVFQKYALFFLLFVGVITGKDALNAENNVLVKASKSRISLQINHHSHAPIIGIAACNFVEENENREDSDNHFSFAFDVSSSNFLTFVGSPISAETSSTHHTFPICVNQKINVLNCTFLI